MFSTALSRGGIAVGVGRMVAVVSRHRCLASSATTICRVPTQAVAGAVGTTSNHILLSGLGASTTNTTTTSRHFSSSPPVFLDQHEVLERILTVVKNFDQVDPSKVHADVKFAEDLGLDSLDIVEVVMAIEDEFAIEIPDQEADKIMTIKDAVEYISTHPMAK